MKTFYFVKTFGGQIIEYEPRRVDLRSKLLCEELGKEIKKRGFCYWELGTPDEGIIYPSEEAALEAINWTINN